MIIWQQIFLYILAAISVGLLVKGRHECSCGNSFGLTRGLFFLGMFVWGDVLILSLFWMMAALVSLFLHDWTLFLLIISIFWLVRSVGETIYWFLQQFASEKRDKPESLLGYSFVKNESIWFIYQVTWQCITVISLVATIYFTHQWLQALSA